jgi:gliding motility-associated-like protein
MAFRKKFLVCVCVLYFLFNFSNLVKAQLTADFTIDKPSGCSPLAIQFTDQSVGSPDTYLWDLGNGNKPTISNPTTIYIDPGVYNVTLTITKGGQTSTKVHTVTVFKNPLADFSASVSKGCLPLDVYFRDISTPGSGTINKWFWDFGDGTNAVTQNPVHKYMQAGKYTVALVLTDNNGCTHTISKSNYIVIDPPSLTTMGFSGTPLSGCDLPFNVVYSNTSTGNGLSYYWDFGDGQTATIKNPSHTYSAAGLYSVFLVGTNAAGCNDTLRKTAYINILKNPVADFNADKTLACALEDISFSNNSSPEFTSFHWTFGDGDTSNLKDPVHQYATSGTFNVTLKVDFGNNCSRSVTKTGFITIKPSGASFTSDFTQGCVLPFTVNFKDLTSSAVSWNWDFGDATGSTLKNPTHTYTNYGKFTVSLATTRTGSSCIETVRMVNYIKIEKRLLGFKTDKRKGCIPLSVAFTDTSVSANPIVSWNWDFGDGGTSTLQNPTHIFNSEKKYDITLITTNSLGCKDTLIRPGYIKAGFPPTKVDFVADRLTACASQAIQFTDLSQHANGWFWQFGNKYVDSTQNPLELFRDTGRYDVTLTADFNGCPMVLKKNLYIYISPPVALFIARSTCKSPYTYTLSEYSIGATTWQWNYGDGTPVSTNRYDTIHTYASRGSYKIKLLVGNAAGCVDSLSFKVYIVDPKANFTALNTSGCPPLPVSFKDQSINARRWRWSFGDGTFAFSQNPVHTYTDSGKFTVSLIVDSMKCKDTLTLKNKVVIGKITADFKIDTAYGCKPLTVELSQMSVPATGINSYTWYFGDNTFYSGIKPPPHVYSIAANYTVSLVIKTNTCRDSAAKVKFIQFKPKPSPDFIIGDTLTCKGSNISFLVKTTAPGYRYLWNFGDGGISISSAPSHAYKNDGVYAVSLKVTDANGCDSSLTKKLVIKNSKANFYATPRFKSCPNLFASFKDSSSSNAIAWNWSFGDGTGSKLQNPSHAYTTSDSNDVQLIITTRLGCTDTIKKKKYIIISGPKGTFAFNPLKGCPPLTVSFLSKATNISKYQWDFGDGSPLGSGAATTHDFNKAGNFHPRLLLTDTAGCTLAFQSPDSIAVKFLTIKAGNNKYICLHDSATIGVSGEGTSFLWTPSTGLSNANIVMPRASPAVTTKYIMQTISGKCSSTDTVTVFVNTAVPTASFTYSGVCFNDNTIFTNTSTLAGPGKITRYDWAWGDGTAASVKDTTHKYALLKTYNVSLTVVTDSGCKHITNKPVEIFSLPIPSFTAVNKCLKDFVLLLDTSTDPSGIKSWVWDLGDGKGLSAKSSFSYQYADTGRYTIRLNVTSNNGCKAATNNTIYVNPIPVANFSSIRDVCLKVPIAFKDSSSLTKGKIVKWKWNFGDGQTAFSKDTTRGYIDPGTYSVSHTATSDSGCSNTITKAGWITTTPIPQADFTIKPSNSEILITNSFSFFNTSKDAVNHVWQFGDGETSTLMNPKHHYSDTGTFAVSLIVTGLNTCPDTKTINVFVTPDFTFYIGNSFTPDGNGINDTFNGYGIGILQYKMEIFDRWGNKLFESNALKDAWDGRVAGGKDIAQMDIYVYKIELLNVFKKTLYYSGHFSLLK